DRRRRQVLLNQGGRRDTGAGQCDDDRDSRRCSRGRRAERDLPIQTKPPVDRDGFVVQATAQLAVERSLVLGNVKLAQRRAEFFVAIVGRVTRRVHCSETPSKRSSSAARNVVRARLSLDPTVPSGTPRISAASP